MSKKFVVLLALISWILAGCSPVGNPSGESLVADQDASPTIPTGPGETVFIDQTPGETLGISATTAAVTELPTFTMTVEPTPVSPPAIILFIGDGMGPNQRLAATWKIAGQEGVLMMDSLPVHGSAQTSTSDGMITDSGASGTSIASGVITNYMAVGVDADGNYVNTILELAQANGWSVGLVTTTSLAHATPAAFASHVPDREQRAEIARQMMAHGIDVMLGGGDDDFFSSAESGCFDGVGIQPSGTTLIADAIAGGYSFICNQEQLLSLDLTSTERVIGLFGADEMLSPYSPTLVEMTQTAINILSQDPDGFFLMVEAGQIDWAGHDNDAEAAIQRTIGLDAAVGYAKIFTIGRPNTLLIVAADHETGGMQLNLDGSGSPLQQGPFAMPDGTTFWVDWTSSSHTDANVPVTAQGPYAEMLSGVYSLTQIYDTMFTYMLYGGMEISD